MLVWSSLSSERALGESWWPSALKGVAGAWGVPFSSTLGVGDAGGMPGGGVATFFFPNISPGV